FDFKSWCDGNGLKKATVDELDKNDLDILEAIKLVAAEDIATLELTLGQRKLLLQAVQGLSKTKNEEKEDNQIKSEDETTPVTTKTLAKDGGLEEIFKKIEGISLDDPLYTLGATEQPSLSAPLGRLDQNPQVFLGSTTQQSSKKGGREQVSLGVVPINMGDRRKCQSSLSVYPLAIANCSENRSAIKMLIARLNIEKRQIKANGLMVDGKKYNVNFKVTLDLKALLLLLVKEDDEDFKLGGRGIELEFCCFCTAFRACKLHWNGAFDETCLTCSQSKSNIGRWSGLRDDLVFLFEEELSNITLCALHCSMRNTEQLVGSLGLFAHRYDALDECNKALSNYGPENSRKMMLSLRLQFHNAQITIDEGDSPESRAAEVTGDSPESRAAEVTGDSPESRAAEVTGDPPVNLLLEYISTFYM
ncbi:hypothetical protein QZH41_012447, partial [Actinostola sp. cb2023]